MKRPLPLAPLGALALLTACATTGPATTTSAPATTLLVGPRFVTGLETPAEVAAVEVDPEGRIVALHADAPTDRPTVRLPGVLAVPGLHDAHIHLLGVGRFKERLDLRDATSPADVAARVAAFAQAHPDASWIDGRGWDQSRFPDRAFPAAADLDGATTLPVLLTRVDGHAAWANSAMLARASITPDTQDPEGGRILRGPDGQPTGVLLDNAMTLARQTLPARTDADRERWARAGADACADAGLVAVHDMGMSTDSLRALAAVDARAPLPLRVFVYLGDDEASYEWLAKHPPPAAVSPRITVQGVKLVADGALGSRGAALLEDYSDEPGHRGLDVTSPAELAARAHRAATLGAQVAIHAIGDRGNRHALAALARAAEAPTSPGLHRVEHAQVVHADDLATFVALGAVASMQPTHATSDMRWAEDRLGPDRIDRAYGWQRMLQRDILLAFGSDAPVESERPVLGLHAATTRTDADGHPAGGWLPDQLVDDRAALRAFAAVPAHVVGRAADLGDLAPGKVLDLTLLAADPRGQPGAWLTTGIAGTIVAGEVRTP